MEIYPTGIQSHSTLKPELTSFSEIKSSDTAEYLKKEKIQFTTPKMNKHTNENSQK
jgi:hypothetical protein